jgi:hypothetical protein
MEGKGTPIHRNAQGNVYRGHPSGGSRGTSQAEAYGRGGYQRPYQIIGGGGYYGGRRGGRRGPNLQSRQGGDVHGQQQSNQPQQQGGAAPMQLPGGTNGGGELGIPNTSADINTIPVNMVALFQQFLASMANKDETKGSGNQERKVDKAEKSKLEKEEPATKVVESST